ncbi:Hypothetical protein HDN1F_10150 [gamma proteobacterium HdN1]|nr:Hypothetical protein HDN1F_10150 [gamma proteobacterium HdN1]
MFTYCNIVCTIVLLGFEQIRKQEVLAMKTNLQPVQSLRLLPPLVMVLLAGCGGGSSGSASNTQNDAPPTGGQEEVAPSETHTGTFMGMLGLDYETGVLRAITDENGRYRYVDGQQVTFRVGDITLGSVAGKSKVSVADLAQGDPQAEENLTRFLLTLDYDMAPMNGVLITGEIRDLARGKTLNFHQDAASFRRDAEALLQAELVSDQYVVAYRHSAEHILPGIYQAQSKQASRALTPFRYPQVLANAKAVPSDFENESREVFDLLLQDTARTGSSPLEYIFKATSTPLVLEGAEGSLQDLYYAYKQRVAAIGPSAPYVARDDLLAGVPAPSGLLNAQHFVVMSDFQMRDDESPLNVNPLKILIPASYYPASPSIPNQLDDMIRTMRAWESQQDKPIEMAIFTGDFTDISQYNELRLGMDVLDGNLVKPDTGKDDDPVPGRFSDGEPNDTYDSFQALGLNATLSEQADIPWYYVAGNHDGLMLGNFPITDAPLNLFGKKLRNGTRGLFDSIATGSTNWLGYDPSLKGFLEHLLKPGTFKIPADSDRRVVTPVEIANEMFNSNTLPHGHGMQHVIERHGNLDGRLHYAFVSESGLIRHVAIDTKMGIGPEGWLDLSDIAWVKKELKAAQQAGQMVIVSSHHRPESIVMNGALLVKTLNSFPNVIAHLVAHDHINLIRPRAGQDPEHGYWEIESGSMVNWPQQFRVLDVQVDKQSGVGVITSTMLNHESASPLHVSQRGRFLAYLERYLEGAPEPEVALVEAEGAAKDRNTRLYFKVPASLMARW